MRRCRFALKKRERQISIHAPMWGATYPIRKKLPYLNISIHAPMWGATLWLQMASSTTKISIHAPMWGATFKEDYYVMKFDISIHAPMWGATMQITSNKALIRFQSTHPCGVRLGIINDPTTAGIFQSTHPCGVRPFNDTLESIDFEISIHAPMWGATCGYKTRIREYY